MRNLIFHTWLALLVAGASLTGVDAASAQPEFAAASIKPNKSGSESWAFGCHGSDTTKSNEMTQFKSTSGKQPKFIPAPLGSCAATNAPLKMLIAYAYNLTVTPDQVDNRVLFGPGWAATERFDITAKAEKPAPDADLRSMLQALLSEQFKLQIRHETQEDLGFALIVAAGGAKLNPPRNNVQIPSSNQAPIIGRSAPGGVMIHSTSRQQTLSMPWATTANFASYLSSRLGKPVIDQTHLTGTYDMTLVLPPLGNGGDGLALLLSAIQEQLGLRLDAQKISTETIIIDNAEEPRQSLVDAARADVRRGQTQVVAPKILSCKPELLAQLQAQLNASSQPAFAAMSNEQVPPDLSMVLSRAGTYVTGYEAQLGNLLGEEIYLQNDAVVKGMKLGTSQQQRTESDFAILHVGKDWIGVREVNCVDGVKVPRQVGAFQKILDDSPTAAANTINNALRESARYNIGVIQRNTNLPTFALRILRPDNARRFEFKRAEEEAVIDGVRVWAVRFQEIQGPTIIRDDDQDEFANGVLWIEPETGQILKTEVNLTVIQGSESFHSQMVVSYKNNPKLEMLLPVSMEEHYETNGNRKLDCRADYLNFHRFEVETHFDFGPIVPSPRPTPNPVPNF